MNRSLRWRRLELAGFGVWRGSTRFHFPEGLGVLCIPNERGKSTMVAGLQAVLLGLSGETDPRGSGIGRYRSWGRPEVCRGSLDLEIDGHALRIRREMVTHRTIVDELDPEGKTVGVLFDGEANPGARAAGRQSYKAFLDDTLGPVADPKTFASTFVIEQPVLPASDMGESTRRLVGGVGRVGGQAAQDALFKVVKSLTKATGDRRLLSRESERPTNQRTDGRIEELETAIRSLEAQREEAMRQFDREESLEEALAQAIEQVDRLREDEKHARVDLARIEAYRRDRGDAETARQTFLDLKRVDDEHEKNLALAQSIRGRISTTYQDLEDAPTDLAARIDTVLKLDETRRTLIESATGFLLEAGATIGVEEQRSRLMAEHEASLASLSLLDRWAHLPGSEGSSSLEPTVWLTRVRAVAERYQSAVGRFVEIDGKHRATYSQRERLAAIAVLPEEAQEELLGLDAARDERERIVRMASAYREEIAARRREFDERYVSLNGFDLPRFLSTLKGRAAHHTRLRELSEEAKELHTLLASLHSGRRWARGLLIGVPAGALLAVVLLLLRLSPVLAATALVVIAGVSLLVFTAPSATVRETRTRLRANERETETVQGRLRSEFIPSGPWLPDDEFAFERARSLVAHRETDAAAIERAERAILSAEGIAPTHEVLPIAGSWSDETEFDIEDRSPDSLAARIAALDRIEVKAKEIAEACGMPAADAVREYHKLSERLQELDERRRGALEAIFGSEAAIRLPDAADAFGARDVGPQHAGAWSAVLQDARMRGAAVRGAGVAGAGSDATGVDSEAAGTLDLLSLPVASLPPDWNLLAQANETLPLGSRTVGELHETLSSMAETRWMGWEDEARAFCAARDRSLRIAETVSAIERVERDLEVARVAVGEARLQASEGDPRRLRQRIREMEGLAVEAASAERTALDILRTARGGPFADRFSLQGALSLAEERRRDLQASIDRALKESELILRYSTEDPAGQDRLRRETIERADRLTATLRQAEGEHAQAQADLKAWQAGSPVNIARIDIEIARRREEIAALRERADAATMAWHLLGESIQEFRSTHQVALGERLDTLFRRITRREGRKIELKPNLDIGILEDGHASREEQLSQGARDQLAFCLRLAIAELVAGEIILPLILDDPFVHSDAERLDRIGEALTEAARDRQVLLLTQDQRLALWGRPVRVETV